MPMKEQQRKQRAIEDARRKQGFMQVFWMHMLRRCGFNFAGAYRTATALSQLWYAWQRVKIAVMGDF